MKQRNAALSAIGLVGAALITGGYYGPQDPKTAIWYRSLTKPAYTPAGSVIGAAWSGLGCLLAYCGFRLFLDEPGRDRDRAIAYWSVTTLGIGLYPWAFFGRKWLAASEAIALAMLGSAAATAATAARIDRPAALAAAPLVAWIAFAALLGEELWRRNDG